MEYGHPVAPSHGHQQMVRPHAPLYDEEPRTEPGLGTVVADEEEHHEKKPVLKKVKDKVRKIKDTITKKRHGHGDDHDDEHYAEGEGYDEEEDEEMEVEPEVHGAPVYESTTVPHGYGSQDEPFTLDRRDEHIDLGTLDSLSGRDEHIPLGPVSRRDESPVAIGSRDERATLGGLQEPPVTPETIKDTTLEADQVAPLPYGSVPPTDVVNFSGHKNAGPTPGNELSVSPEVLTSLQAMTISAQEEGQQKDQHGTDTAHLASDIGKKPTYTEKLSSTAAAAKDAAMSAASTVYSKVAGTTPTGTPTETRSRSTEEGDKKPSYTEKLSSTATAAKDAAVSAASNVYAKVAGGTHSTEPHDQGSTPVSTGPGVEVQARESAGEKKGSYTEKLSSTAAAAKDAAVHAASAVYGKVAGGTHSSITHDQVVTPVRTGPGVEVEAREGASDGAGEKKGTYTEKLSGTALAAKDAAVNAASTVYGKVAGAGSAVMGKVQPGGRTEQDKGVSVREYLVEKLRPGDEDRALCEVISESMKKRGEEQHKVGGEKGRIVLAEVTGGEVGEKQVIGTDETSRYGERGMVENIKGAVSSLVGGDGGSGGPAAATEATGGGATRGRAHEEMDY